MSTEPKTNVSTETKKNKIIILNIILVAVIFLLSSTVLYYGLNFGNRSGVVLKDSSRSGNESNETVKDTTRFNKLDPKDPIDFKVSSPFVKTGDIDPISYENAPFGVGLVNPGHRCFIHSLIQILYHCSDFRKSLESKTISGNDEVIVAAAIDLNTIFTTMDKAPLGGVLEFDFGISEPETSNDNLIALLASNDLFENITELLFLIESYKNQSIEEIQTKVRENFVGKSLSEDIIKMILKTFEEKPKSTAVEVKAAIPDHVKDGSMNDPMSILEHYVNFLQSDDFILNEALYLQDPNSDLKTILKTDSNVFIKLNASNSMHEGINSRYTESNGKSDNGQDIYIKIHEPLPNNLIIQTNRANYDPLNNTMIKDETKIQNPEIIDLSPFLAKVSSDTTPNCTYDLVSFTVHCNDHHYSVVKGSNGIWYKFDDDKISQLDRQSMLEEAQNGYILMYHKVDDESQEIM